MSRNFDRYCATSVDGPGPPSLPTELSANLGNIWIQFEIEKLGQEDGETGLQTLLDNKEWGPPTSKTPKTEEAETRKMAPRAHSQKRMLKSLNFHR
ncbi:hypothetical protein CapIbe_012818 [Capra ibex]